MSDDDSFNIGYHNTIVRHDLNWINNSCYQIVLWSS